MAYVRLGYILHDQNKFAEAEAATRKATNSNPTLPGVRQPRDHSAVARRASASEAAIRKGIELHPDDPGLLRPRPHADQNRNLADGELAFRKAIELHPNLPTRTAIWARRF